MPPNIAAIATQPRPSESAVEAKKSETLYHYGITRSDIPPITRAVQSFHAAGESSPGNLHKGTFARLLMVDSERELKELGWELFRNGIKTSLVFEPDAPWNGQLMAIGLEPIWSGTPKYKLVREITRRLQRLDMEVRP